MRERTDPESRLEGSADREPSELTISPELPPRAWRIMLSVLRHSPQSVLSRALGRLADLPLPRRARRAVHTTFARSVGIDLAETELPLEAYPTLNDFFVRRLRPGLRAWPSAEDLVCSPVDGILGRRGRIRSGRLIQAKGRSYSAADLLADETAGAGFEDGLFFTLYLSPRHYHRVHSPCGGRITEAAHVPGTLLPVNAPAVQHEPDLFARNERVLCHLEGQPGRVAVVAVGAYNVGRISTAFDPQWRPPPSAGGRRARLRTVERRSYDPSLAVGVGDELMTFHLGSTVVLLVEPGSEIASAELEPGTELRLGMPLARRERCRPGTG